MQFHFSTPFGRSVSQFCKTDSLFFNSRFSRVRIHQACKSIQHAFRERIYTPSVVMWMFVGQTLSSDHSCRDAVSRFNVWRIAQGLKPCSAETTSYCDARQQLPEQLPLELARSIGQDCVAEAKPKWLWKARNVKMVDGTMVTMADTPENQAEYPQPTSQKPGVGFPIARLLLIVSLAVGAVLEVAIGTYSGKLTGETSLLRTLLNTILSGDILLADRFHANYWLLASAWEKGFDVVVRAHQLRKIDFRRGLRIGHYDQIVAYHKPKQRPYWMTKEEYDAYDEFILVRHLRYKVKQSGFRSKEITIATTLLDAEVYSAEEIASLYQQRWQVELDIRSIKTHLQMEHLRCKSPSMVRKEIYCHLLAYNLARAAMVESALIFEKNPNQLSFKGAVQAINAFTSAVAAGGRNLELQYQNMLQTIATYEVGDRPNRSEPREKKRRPKTYTLMKLPRHQARKRAA